MKAAFFRSHGGIENLEVGEIEAPKISPTEVLIETSFGGLNHLDLFVMKGWPGLKLELPHILGSDGAGLVKKVGHSVFGIKPGDKVLVNPGISCGTCEMCLGGEQSLCKKFYMIGEHKKGTYAELFKVPGVNVLKLPNDYPLNLAAAAPLNFLTAWRMIKTRANLQPSETIVIQGAGGGVATAAIQIAKYLGATVITTTSSEEKMEKAQKLGADFVLNYKTEPEYSKKVYSEITHRKGVDVVIDSVGTPTFNTSLRMLKQNGRLVTCGATMGGKTEIDIQSIFWKQLQILGSTMSSQKEFRDVMKLVTSWKMSPVIDKIFPLDEIAQAEEYLESGEQFGKVLIKI